jgi:hypothetical protein
MVLGVKQPECEAEHPPRSSGRVKNMLNFTSAPHVLKHGDKFTFCLPYARVLLPVWSFYYLGKFFIVSQSNLQGMYSCMFPSVNLTSELLFYANMFCPSHSYI